MKARGLPQYWSFSVSVFFLIDRCCIYSLLYAVPTWKTFLDSLLWSPCLFHCQTTAFDYWRYIENLKDQVITFSLFFLFFATFSSFFPFSFLRQSYHVHKASLEIRDPAEILICLHAGAFHFYLNALVILTLPLISKTNLC